MKRALLAALLAFGAFGGFAAGTASLVHGLRGEHCHAPTP